MPRRKVKSEGRVNSTRAELGDDHTWEGEQPGDKNDSLTDLQWLEALKAVPVSSSALPALAKPSTIWEDDSKASESSDPADLLSLFPRDPYHEVYKTDPDVKPPFSYATLICLAIKAAGKSKVTLNTIYRFIKENFIYYRHAGAGWQVSLAYGWLCTVCGCHLCFIDFGNVYWPQHII